MKLFDLFGIIRKHSLPLIRSYEGNDGCTVFEFSITGKHINWKAGQHGFFTLPNKNVTGQKWRAFSVCSIPSEGVLQIATKISDTPSSFKQALRSLQPGEEIQVRGPYGWLYFQDKHSPVVMVAGGVGITPFRALFKELEQGNERQVKLIYSAYETYLFKDELDAIAEKDEKVSINYTHTKEEVAAAIMEAVSKANKDTYYFISGSPGMVKGIGKQLRKLGVSNKKIINDSFRGY